MLEKMKGAVLGFAAADALGVPVEFHARAELREDPVTDMRGWGTYSQLPGTWSDDTGMLLATMDSLKAGYDPENMMQHYVAWEHGNYWPYGEVFDVGMTTGRAISRYKKGVPAEACGSTGENENGNGALMRILPFAFYLYPKSGGLICRNEQGMKELHSACRLTHAHPRSRIACGMYVAIACQLLAGLDIPSAVQTGIMEAANYYLHQPYAQELNYYARLADFRKFLSLPESRIRSTGYVVDTLEAALYCLCKTNSYKDCVLKAVNLGEDTDTVAAVAGGLAGIYYGVNAIPPAWRFILPKRGQMEVLCEEMYRTLI